LRKYQLVVVFWVFLFAAGVGVLRVLREVFLPLFVSIVSLFVAESDSRVVFVALRV
jgi:hypothetical protein